MPCFQTSVLFEALKCPCLAALIRIALYVVCRSRVVNKLMPMSTGQSNKMRKTVCQGYLGVFKGN